MNKALIVMCGKKKLPGMMKALDLYRAGHFSVIRANLKKDNLFDKAKNPDIFILSAKYGLIKGEEIIEYYDERMTYEKARAYRPELHERVNNIIETHDKTLLHIGAEYKEVFTEEQLNHPKVIWTRGQMLKGFKMIKEFLNEE